MRVIAILALLALFPAALRADDCTNFAPHAVTNYATSYAKTELNTARPTYLMPQRLDNLFNAVATRVTGDSGTAMLHVAASMWGADGRHQYSTRPAWNATQALIYIENGQYNDCDLQMVCNGPDVGPTYNGPASPKRLLLDGTTYVPLAVGQGTAMTDANVQDQTWHPSSVYADIMIQVWDAPAQSSRLQWCNVRTGAVYSWTLPIKTSAIGPYEGAPSNDGRYLALISDVGNQVVVIDMQGAPTTAPRMSNPFDLPSCPLLCGTNPCDVGLDGGYVTVSSKGTYLIVTYKRNFHRVFDIDWGSPTPSIIPGGHDLVASTYACYNNDVALDPHAGWLIPLSHVDRVTYLDEEYLVGFDACYTSSTTCGSSIHSQAKSNGRLVLAKLSDGSVRHISAGTADDLPGNPVDDGEEAGHHVAARHVAGSTDWVYASYQKNQDPSVPETGGDHRMRGEIVAWSLGPTKAVKRLAWSHSSWSACDQGLGCFRAEVHPSPSRDGCRIMFASNWRRYTQGVENYPPNTWRKAYVLDTRPTPSAITNLTLTGPSCNAIRLQWTAPYDDLVTSTGTVQTYEVRRSGAPLTPENFYDGILVNPPTPVPGGQTQTLLITGLAGNQFFAVKAVGTNGPRAAMSNVVCGRAACPPSPDCDSGEPPPPREIDP